MEVDQIVIRRDTKVKCLKRSPDDTEIEGVVSHVYEDCQHVDIRYGFLEMLSRENVHIRFIEVK